MFRPSCAVLAAVPRRLFSSAAVRRDAFADLAKITGGTPASQASPFAQVEVVQQANMRGYAPRMLAPEEDPVLELFTNLIMKHGKKAEAQKHVMNILALIQRATNAPPVPQLKKAIELSSPTLTVLSMRKRAKTVQTPRALNERQRTRQGIVWLLKASERGRGSKAKRDDRVAREVLAVLEGTSDVFKRVEEVHKLAMMNRYVLVAALDRLADVLQLQPLRHLKLIHITTMHRYHSRQSSDGMSSGRDGQRR